MTDASPPEPLPENTQVVPFAGIDLLIGPGVFTPQPETEPVVRAVLAAMADLDSPVVVDLGTGSGAIALAVAAAARSARVVGVEAHDDALAWAHRNRDRLGLDVRLERAAALDALPDLDGRVDIVVSNPPYVAEHEFADVDPEVRDNDPASAMLAGVDGLDAIRDVEQAAWRLLRPRGTVVVEHSDRQGESAPAVFARRWHDVRDCADQLGRPRYVVARKPAAG